MTFKTTILALSALLILGCGKKEEGDNGSSKTDKDGTERLQEADRRKASQPVGVERPRYAEAGSRGQRAG